MYPRGVFVKVAVLMLQLTESLGMSKFKAKVDLVARKAASRVINRTVPNGVALAMPINVPFVI